MTIWEKLPPIKGHTACLTCGAGAHDTLPLDAVIAVGFGAAGYRKDDLCSQAPEPLEESEDEYLLVSDVEAMAVEDPDHDWRIYFFAPLYEAEYQRQGAGHWVLVSKGHGFA